MTAKLLDRDLISPADGVTEEDIERAHDADPAPFPDVEMQDDEPLEGEPLTDQASTLHQLVQIGPASAPQACANAKALTDNHTPVGVGMCLRTVRGPIFGLPAMWPTAAIAYRHGRPYHKFDDLTLIPRGMWISWVNPDLDDPGHTALSIGGGLCRTTDYHENGFVGIALIGKLEAWCGDPFRGGAEILNGFDVWQPNPKPVDPTPEHDFHAWDWQERFKYLRAEAAREGRAKHPVVARQLREWSDKIAARHPDERKQKGSKP